MPNIHQIEHPVSQQLLGQLRRSETEPAMFRQIAAKLTQFLAIEATRQLATETITVETPVATANAVKLTQTIGIVPILRAGLAMTDPILDLIPNASVFHLGMYRDEETATPVEYYSKLTNSNPVDIALIVDPMLATGGSASLAINALKSWGVPRLNLLTLIASSEGIDRITNEYADVSIYTCAIDPILNAQKYIVPGLGDAGDRIFNTL